MVELPQNPLKHRHHWKQWSGGLKAFYGDDLSCRSTHKQGLDVNIRFPCSNPRRLHCSDYTALIIRQYRRLLSICIVRAQAQYLISRVGVISLQTSERGRLKERGCEQDGEQLKVKSQLDGKPAGAGSTRGGRRHTMF